jgi:dTDP-4-amino-4,6-dideoxygalactose transaminase
MWLIPRRWPDTAPGELRLLRAECDNPGAEKSALVGQWEECVARFVGMPHAVAVNSGRLGMRLILEHLGIGPGHEVIVPAYTLKDLLPLIQDTGAAAVPADIDPRTLNVTAGSVAARITPATRAMVVLHAFGAPAPVDAIAALAEARGIPVIEDCAHSLGATLNGRQTGSFGYAAFFSFEPTKPVNTYGGGMVVTGDAELARFVRGRVENLPLDAATLLKKAAATRQEKLLTGTGLAWPLLMLLASPRGKALLSRAYRGAQSVPSGGARYHPAQARMGIARLGTLPERLAARRRAARLLISLLDPSIRVQQLLPGAESTWYFFVVVLPKRAAALRAPLLARYGVDAAVGEEIADECARILGRADCPGVVDVYFNAMALPMFDSICESRVRRVAAALNRLAQ